MDEVRPTTADLLESWREATRAAELAQRLARQAREASARADTRAIATEELATLAERAAAAANEAARIAREVADEAAAFAVVSHETHERDEMALGGAERTEADARVTYLDRVADVAERGARNGDH